MSRNSEVSGVADAEGRGTHQWRRRRSFNLSAPLATSTLRLSTPLHEGLVSRSDSFLRRIEHQCAHFDAFPRRSIGTAGRIFKRTVSREARAAVLLRVVALQQNDLALFESRKVEPAMVRIVGEAIGLTDFVAIDQIGRDEVFGIDRAGIADRERRRFDGSAYRAPYVDFDKAMLQPLLGLRRRQVIADAARSRLGGVVIVNRFAIFTRVLFSARGQLDIAHLMIEDHYFLGASRFFQ